MEPSEQKIMQLPQRLHSPFNAKSLEISSSTKFGCSKVAALVNNLEECHISTMSINNSNLQKVGCDHSSAAKKSTDSFMSATNIGNNTNKLNQSLTGERNTILQRKQPLYATRNSLYETTSKVTLDNPAILEQQLEALAHHKKQLEKKGLLSQSNEQQKLNPGGGIPKLSTTSLMNIHPKSVQNNVYSNVTEKNKRFHDIREIQQAVLSKSSANNIYCNVPYDKDTLDDVPPPPAVPSCAPLDSRLFVSHSHEPDDDIPQPPSPVSSSYSELRRAIDVFSKNPTSCSQQNGEAISNKGTQFSHYDEHVSAVNDKLQMQGNNQQTYMNMNYSNDYAGYSPTMPSISHDSSDFYGYGSFSQASSTYESIYEPINPRPPSQLSTRSNFLMYTPYVNGSSVGSGSSCGILNNNMSSNFGAINAGSTNAGKTKTNVQKEADVEALNDFLVHSMDSSNNDGDSYGVCFKCNDRVFGENSGCTAMNQIYHIACFTCCQCQINLQGKPFYALEGKPFCEYDYLQTLEKCSVCMKPILERILRATGKPYHPACFTCIVCGNSLDGIPFTVDATNQNYCIADFHKKFAPRCCVCKEPIMPEPGEEETVRVVALDRSFHFECYKCEDCGLLLSSEAEGRGCYPLDDHVLCKSCNAKRVQMLTNRMTTEL